MRKNQGSLPIINQKERHDTVCITFYIILIIFLMATYIDEIYTNNVVIDTVTNILPWYLQQIIYNTHVIMQELNITTEFLRATCYKAEAETYP